MRVIAPFDPSTLAMANSSAPTTGIGTAKNSGLTNQCGALYFLNKSNVGVNIVFEDGSYSILPPWFARVYVLKNKSNQLWMSQAYSLNSQGQPISQLYWEAYQQGEDTTGLYNGPLPYQLNVGNTVLTATNLVNRNNTAVAPIVDANYTPGGGVVKAALINDDGSAQFGEGLPLVTQVSWDAAGNLSATQSVTTGALNANAPVKLKTTNQETGKCGDSYTNAAAGQTMGPTVNYKTVMTNVPTSITLGTPSENVNANAPAVGDIDIFGFWLEWSAPGAGTSRYVNTYTTVGN